jgi:hypothetical protein
MQINGRTPIYQTLTIPRSFTTLDKPERHETHVSIWSAATDRLETPSFRCSTIGGRAFPAAAAEAWNTWLASPVSSAPRWKPSDAH